MSEWINPSIHYERKIEDLENILEETCDFASRVYLKRDIRLAQRKLETARRMEMMGAIDSVNSTIRSHAASKDNAAMSQQVNQITKMKKTKCKMVVNSVKNENGNVSFHATPVTSGSEENKSFFNATPSGELRLHVINEEALDGIKEGDEVYVTIEKAVAEETSDVNDSASPGVI